jgi:histidinol phosphatase-like PHP family hydrolase
VENAALVPTLIRYDFHAHSLLSDGALLLSELARRYSCNGYSVVAVADHVDHSNIEIVVPAIAKGSEQWNEDPDAKLRLVPGAEITHVPPSQIPSLITKARDLGAKIVLVHGETLTEPVRPGTNRAGIEGGANILAHPGLISEEDAQLAAQSGVLLEITARTGHCLTNGHVALTARRSAAEVLINSDSHSPGDIPHPERVAQIGLGAGLSQQELAEVESRMARLVEKCG